MEGLPKYVKSMRQRSPGAIVEAAFPNEVMLSYKEGAGKENSEHTHTSFLYPDSELWVTGKGEEPLRH